MVYGNSFYSIVCLIALALCGIFLCECLMRTVQWIQQKHPSRPARVISILLPVLLLLCGLPHFTEAFLQDFPISKAELATTSSPLEELRQYEYCYAIGRTTSHKYMYSLRLQSQKQLYLPYDTSIPIDREEFLTWVGDDELTCRYDDKDNTIYEIQREDGAYWLTWAQSEERLRKADLDRFMIRICLLVLAMGVAMRLPAWLGKGDSFEKKALKWVSVFFGVIGVSIFVFLSSLFPRQPVIEDMSADTSIEVQLGEGMQVMLPSDDWEEIPNNNGDHWYKTKGEQVLNQFLLMDDLDSAWNGSQEEWEQLVLENVRMFLLDRLITQPWTEQDPFLTEMSTWESEHGVCWVYSQGWGASDAGRKEHFLLLLLYQQKKAILIQSSAIQTTDWGEFRDYVEQWVLPLLDYIRVEDAK